MAIPLMPFASRSSMMRCCSAAVPSAGIRKSTWMPGISLTAFSVPLRAMTQKSEALLGTKASLCVPPVLWELVMLVGEALGWQLLRITAHTSAQTILSNERVAFTGCIGFLGCWVLLRLFLAHSG